MGWWSAGCVLLIKDIDDEHRRAALRTDEGWEGSSVTAIVVICVVCSGFRARGWEQEQLAGMSQVILAPGVGEQAVVSDAMESVRQDMDEEAPDELVGGQGHGFVASPSFVAIVFIFEGDTVIIMRYQAGVGDGDAVGVSGEVSEYGVGP